MLHQSVNKLKYALQNFCYFVGEYHKYDTIVYPKKTQVSKSWKETLSGYVSRLFSRKKTSDVSKEEEFVPMEFQEMYADCLRCYLEDYKDMVCEGRFHQGSNFGVAVKKISHILSSISSFHLCHMGPHGQAFYVSVPDLKIKEVGL